MIGRRFRLLAEATWLKRTVLVRFDLEARRYPGIWSAKGPDSLTAQCAFREIADVLIVALISLFGYRSLTLFVFSGAGGD